MNNFLQRMLKKSDDEWDGEKLNLDNTKSKIDHPNDSNKSSSWIKKLGSCSPSKSDSKTSTRSPSRPITVKPGEYRDDYRRRNVPESRTTKSTTKNESMPNLENIIREFEMGFLSPTKHAPIETTKSGRFVKKIVAAFEEKYKPFNDVKVEAKKSSIESESSDDSSFEDEKTVANMMEESTVIFDDTYVIESLERRLTRYLDSYVASSSIRDDEQRSDNGNEEKSDNGQQSDDEISIDLGKCSFAMDEELNRSTVKTSRETMKKSPKKEITSLTNVNSTAMTSSSNLVRTDSSLRRERKPKIVGAYLKKPIEVEDTSIDWIPITSKKLPRKRSFKKLLSILTGKKSSQKSSKLYCSESNLQEETTKELLHDSGYDEKSGSSSSLVSLVSIDDLLLQQQFNDFPINKNDRRSFNMTTFQRQTSVSSVEQDSENDNDYNDDLSSMCDDVSDTWSMSSRKLLFEEVSRSELRLSLGPAFPSAVRGIEICSLDRRATKSSTSKKFRNSSTMIEEILPLASPLPKHPFVSMRKNLNDEDDRKSRGLSNEMTIQREISIDEKKLLRNFRSWTFPTEDIAYDTPRQYLSKSEPGLVSIGKERGHVDSSFDNVYDVPKEPNSRRPKSSIYDEAISLKRRNEQFSRYSVPTSNRFYTFPCNQEPHYATVKPRNTKICPSKELLRSIDDPTETRYLGHYYGRITDGLRNY